MVGRHNVDKAIQQLGFSVLIRRSVLGTRLNCKHLKRRSLAGKQDAAQVLLDRDSFLFPLRLRGSRHGS
jgi:hypothetical protein